MLESPKRLAIEALPVAAILLFWNLLGWVAQLQNVGGAVRSAGVVMATLYVVVRGVSLSDRTVPRSGVNMETVVMENVQVAVPAGAWFVAAMVVSMLETWVRGLSELLGIVAGALAGAGLGVVGLYAVAAGYRALDDGIAGGEVTTSDGTGSDERPAND